jgi:hypothetical protein
MVAAAMGDSLSWARLAQKGFARNERVVNSRLPETGFPRHCPAMNYHAALVPGRECGECTLCCSAQNIDKPDVQKASGVLCKHCTGGGCAIYETRFDVCRAFHCAWRQMPTMDDTWRPDRSGVFVEFQLLDGVTGLSLMLVGNPLKSVRQPAFIDFVANGVTRNVPLWMTLPGPPGYQGAQSLMNTHPMRQAAATSRGHVKALLEVQLKRLQAYPFARYVPKNSGNSVGSAPDIGSADG